MPLTGRQFKELQAALLDAFDYSSLKQMVLTELDTDLEEVALGGSLQEVTLKLITWAEQTGRMQELVAGALAANQGNLRLQQFAAQYAGTLAAETSPTPLAVPASGGAAPAQQPHPVWGQFSTGAVASVALVLLVLLGLAVAGLLRAARDRPAATPAVTATAPGNLLSSESPTAGSTLASPPATLDTNVPPTFTSDYVYDPELIEQIEFSFEPGMLPTETITDFLQLSRVALGDLDTHERAYNVQLKLKNTGSRPIILDLNRRFFSFEDDQGRKAELVYFCCDAKGELLSGGQSRTMQMFFLESPGWEGKETSAKSLFFKVRGLKPVVRATWQIPILGMAE